MESIYFRSKFWDSLSVSKMTTSEKLIYIYLITNEKTKPSGIYRFFLLDCISRTGLKEKQIRSAMDKFQKVQLILPLHPWVFVTRFLEETFNLNKKTLSDKIKISIANQFKQEKVPIELIGWFDSFYNTLSISYPYPLDTILDFRLEILDFRLEKGDLISSSKAEEKITYNYKTNKFENISKEVIGRWGEAYPAANINAEILKAGVWLESNLNNRKSDIKRFLNNWLVKAQDKAPRQKKPSNVNDDYDNNPLINKDDE